MLGIVYTEFMGMVAEQFSETVLDDLLDTPGLSTSGAYTAVGYYDHTDIIKMVVALSKLVDVPVDDLVEAFGRHLFSTLISKYPTLAKGQTSTLDMLETVDGAVHTEVQKLYPNAELPEFTCERLGADELKMVYRSKRPFSLLALGLIRGCADHFGESIQVSHTSKDQDSIYVTEFNILTLR
jgi:hypothetical protein